MLQTLRSPSIVWVASISVFCLEEEPCQARPVILDGARFVVNVCNIVNEGCKVAISIDPLRYPIANVRQSAEGAIEVIGSKIVLAEMCSEVDGSNKIMLP